MSTKTHASPYPFDDPSKDPRPWYVVKLEKETDLKFDDMRRELRALRWTLAAVAALAALAGNLVGSLPG